MAKRISLSHPISRQNAGAGLWGLVSPHPRQRRPVLSALVLAVAGAGGLAVWAPSPVRCPAVDADTVAGLYARAPAVQVWMTPLAPLGGRAVHTHFLYVSRADGAEVHRVEVWQEALPERGHVWVDENTALWDQEQGLCLLGERTGSEAEAVIAELEAAAAGAYPWRDRYLPVPGPNSNTFTAEILRRAGWALDRPPQAIGQRFPVGER